MNGADAAFRQIQHRQSANTYQTQTWRTLAVRVVCVWCAFRVRLLCV